MSLLIIMVLIFGIVFFVIKNKKIDKHTKNNRTPITGKRVLTMNEQPMFNRLNEALPEYYILAQVSFSAFMTAKGYATRALFNRKFADFVVVDKHFNVVAVIELDDASHNGQEERDTQRDALVNEAGFKVIRYKRTPEVQKIRSDLGLGLL
ncbi:DUF2726 domain-containing protein [Acinetobacter boissieri]|uniref:DUF2726 domain-containing protein n=1 Tax=Acinetobacter boissieri TaxID=1219383 RepID=A0A1G6HF19_9GAMM|nr:DUF2726 domain-containing protein [Acinetobacter boissieri]SDB92753.1 Protein of unknown function [Acinetobacter boissieri]